MYVTMAFSFKPKTSPSQCHSMAFKDKHQGTQAATDNCSITSTHWTALLEPCVGKALTQLTVF